MMNVYYVNSRNVKIPLSEWPIAIEDITGLFKKVWERSTTKNRSSNASKINYFYRTELETTINIQVFADSKEEFDNLMNTIYEETEIDIINKTPGKLYCGEYYLMCYIANIETGNYEELYDTIDNSAKIYSPHSFWIKDLKFTFLPSSASDPESDGLDFPTDFPFDFASSGNKTVHRTVDHYAPSHFQMTVYGPCVDPRITINSYPYQVFATLETGEYLVIDSRENTITKYLNNGTTENLYNSRQFEPSVFEKIPSGNLAFDWPGTFGFDVTLFLERSEPKWK